MPLSLHCPSHNRPLMLGLAAVLWLALAVPLPAVAAGLGHRQRLTGAWGGVKAAVLWRGTA